MADPHSTHRETVMGDSYPPLDAPSPAAGPTESASTGGSANPGPPSGFPIVESILRERRGGGPSATLDAVLTDANARLDKRLAESDGRRIARDADAVRKGWQRVAELIETLHAAGRNP